MDKDNGQEFGLWAREIAHVINFIGSPDSGTIQEVIVLKWLHGVHSPDKSQMNSLKILNCYIYSGENKVKNVFIEFSLLKIHLFQMLINVFFLIYDLCLLNLLYTQTQKFTSA